MVDTSPTHRLYFVSVRWNKTPMNPELVDRALGSKGDWLRFNAQCWLDWTSETENQLNASLMAILHKEDSVLVMRVDPINYTGWAPKWVWDWVKERVGAPRGY
jgi:hypothetical protein